MVLKTNKYSNSVIHEKCFDSTKPHDDLKRKVHINLGNRNVFGASELQNEILFSRVSFSTVKRNAVYLTFRRILHIQLTKVSDFATFPNLGVFITLSE